MSEWRPIETAPRDGTQILLVGGDKEVFMGYWAWNGVGRFTDSVRGWVGHELGYVQDHDLIGWMPLPEPPEDT
jgi:hypothetical protein